ncbi:SAM and SH3 domain-containing protein 1 [Trichonephila inaurata madagascariensis]|uniref:SAM and SH3 domain-containing protein 1 n=1 Tax=Trichonephila inaurata madagascariensis TaxID=2747483 RepID=A0A8X6WXY6_9ARAC|nr:SAM and SH3 domain-containing protein 1 [Trichonephila inaurata madagascariensis]
MTYEVPDSNTAILETPDSAENISKDCDSLSNHQSVLSNSNQGFSSTGEEESFAEGGRVLGRARALVDCTPSPYDKDGLAFKKGDVIDILAKSSSGYWVGRLRNQIGHFKFINVEEIQNGDRKTSKRRLSSFEQKSNLAKTLEDLLEHLGLEVYMNVLVLNGYHNLDSLKGVEEQDLISLGIVNSDHRMKLLNAIDYFEDLSLGTAVSSGSVEGTQSPLHQQKSNHVPFSSKLFSSPRRRSESCSSNVADSYLPQHSYSPKVSNSDSYPETAYTCNEINNLDYGMPTVTRNNGTEQIDDDRHREILNIPLNRPSDKLYFYSDLHSNQKIHYSYGRGISAYSEQLYFSRAGLVIDTPNKSHLLSQMNYLEKLSDFSVGGNTFNHLNGSIYPNSGAYITKEEKYLMESSRRKLKDQMRSFGMPQDTNHVEQRRNESDFNGYLDETSFQNLESGQNNSKSLTLPRQMKGCPPGDLLILQATDVYKSERKGKKSRRRKESPQPILQCSTQPFTLDDFVAKKLQDEQIDLCAEPYTDKTGFCGIPPALVQRYADELQQDIFDVAEALDRERIRALQMRGRPAVPNDFLADSCCEPVVEANYSNLSDWLISLGLPIYEKLFHRNGCTELYHIASLKDKDLIRYGIENAKHIRLLTTAIEALHIHIEHCQYIA